MKAPVKSATKPEEDVAAILDSPPQEAKAEAAAPKEKAVKDRPLPKELLEQYDEVTKLLANVQKQIEDFKSGQAYIEGDLPVTLRGMGGPGFELGQRSLIWVDDRHLDSNLAFRWCNKRPDIIGHHVGNGRWPEPWDHFVAMVKARGGAAARYELRFQKSPEGYVTCGDMLLMATTKDQDEYLKARIRRRTANLEGTAKGVLYSECEKLGTEPIEGDLGSPLVQKIVRMVEKELGGNAKRVFLGK